MQHMISCSAAAAHFTLIVGNSPRKILQSKKLK